MYEGLLLLSTLRLAKFRPAFTPKCICDFVIVERQISIERVGSLQIIDGLKQTGSPSYEGDFERFEEIFSDLDNHIKVFQYQRYPVKTLCDI